MLTLYQPNLYSSELSGFQKAAIICKLQNWSYSDYFFWPDQKTQLQIVFNR